MICIDPPLNSTGVKRHVPAEGIHTPHFDTLANALSKTAAQSLL